VITDNKILTVADDVLSVVRRLADAAAATLFLPDKLLPGKSFHRFLAVSHLAVDAPLAAHAAHANENS